jgi:hypothetical protein
MHANDTAATIISLPSELLRGIFHIATPYKDASTVLARQTLLHVCRAFYVVASRDPTFWADLDLLWPGQASWLLARAERVPLRVYLHDTAGAYAENRYHPPLTGKGFLARLAPRVEALWLHLIEHHADRIQSLDFVLEWHTSSALGFMTRHILQPHAATFAQLSRIHVNLRIPDERQQYIHGLLAYDFPALRDLRLGHCVLDMSSLTPQSLRTVHPTGPMFRHIPLRCTPDLVCLAMDVSASVIPEEKVVLAALRRMSLRAQAIHGSGHDVVRFVHQIEAPSLHVLEAACVDTIDPIASFDKFIDDTFMAGRPQPDIALTSIQKLSASDGRQCHTFRLQSGDRSLWVKTRVRYDAPHAAMLRSMKPELRDAITSLRVGGRNGGCQGLWVQGFSALRGVTTVRTDQLAARALFRIWADDPAYLPAACALDICAHHSEPHCRVTLDSKETQLALANRARDEKPVRSVRISGGSMVAISEWKHGLEDIGIEVEENVSKGLGVNAEDMSCSCT